jgi:hypothetical protein
MILKFDHESGAVTEADVPAPVELFASEVAHGVIALCEDVRRVRVWDHGRSPVSDDGPAFDLDRENSGDAMVPLDDSVLEALRDCLCGIPGLGGVEPKPPSPRAAIMGPV